MSDLNSSIQAVHAASSPGSLIQAVRQLAQLQDPDAIPMLIEVLGYNNPGAAIAAVEGLVKLGDVAVPILLNNIDSYDYGARAWANRALAEIGHPHALENLLEAASNDFALSVRRAATKGLGSLQWSKLPPEKQKTAQEKALQALLQISVDVEWVVRYAAIVGLEGLAQQQPAFVGPISEHLQQRGNGEPELAVQARVVLALQRLEEKVP